VNGRRPVNLFGSDEANERAKELIEAIVRQDELGIKKGQSSGSDGNQRSNMVRDSKSISNLVQYESPQENARPGSALNG
jgi:hypothetical protein